MGVAQRVVRLEWPAETQLPGLIHNPARRNEIPQHDGALAVHVRRDLMRRQVRDLRELHGDVVSGGAEPDIAPVPAALAALPEADGIALAPGLAWPLEGIILPAAKQVETAHRRGGVVSFVKRV